MRKNFCAIFPAVAIVATVLAFGQSAQAATIYGFATLDNAGDPLFNQLLGINTAGTIAGYFGDGVIQPNQGYTLVPPASYANENFPNSVQTQVVGIDDSGPPPITVGFYVDANNNTFGFVDRNGIFTSVSDPNTPITGATVNQLLGVNDHDVAAGFYVDANGNDQAYLYNFAFSSRGPSFTAVTLPASFGAVDTTATDYSDLGGVVSGFFTDGAGNVHGFVGTGTSFTQLDDPSGTATMILGLNNEGQFVGSYVDVNGETQGFVYNINSNTWQTISDPNASATPEFGVTGTTVNGINDLGDLVGFYSDGVAAVDGFLATPAPEPASFGLVLLGAGLIFSLRRLRAPRP